MQTQESCLAELLKALVNKRNNPPTHTGKKKDVHLHDRKRDEPRYVVIKTRSNNYSISLRAYITSFNKAP